MWKQHYHQNVVNHDSYKASILNRGIIRTMVMTINMVIIKTKQHQTFWIYEHFNANSECQGAKNASRNRMDRISSITFSEAL